MKKLRRGEKTVAVMAFVVVLIWWLFSAGMKSGGSVRCYRGGIWLESGVSS
jgi:hypothetical protein